MKKKIAVSKDASRYAKAYSLPKKSSYLVEKSNETFPLQPILRWGKVVFTQQPKGYLRRP